MATVHIDVKVEDRPFNHAVTNPSSAITNAVRVTWQDTLTKEQVVQSLEKIILTIQQTNLPLA